YLSQAQGLAGALELDGRVIFKDLVPIEQLPDLLRTASLGLVPNHANSATHLMLPVKLLEYAVMGIPTIVSRLNTIEHYFGKDGLCYFEPGNEAHLARAIEELYRSPELRNRFVASARLVAKRLSWSAQRTRFYAAIDSLLTTTNGEFRDSIKRAEHGALDRGFGGHDEEEAEQNSHWTWR